MRDVLPAALADAVLGALVADAKAVSWERPLWHVRGQAHATPRSTAGYHLGDGPVSLEDDGYGRRDLRVAPPAPSQLGLLLDATVNTAEDLGLSLARARGLPAPFAVLRCYAADLSF